MQAAHVVEEWVDHALSKSKEEESYQIVATKAKLQPRRGTRKPFLG